MLIQLPWKLQVLVEQSSFIDSRAASHIMHWVKHSFFPVFFALHHSPSPTPNWYLYALIRSPWDFSYAGKAALSLSAYSQMRDALTSSYLIHLCDPSLDYLQWTGLSPRLSCSGDPRTGASTPDVSHERWAEGKDHLHQPIGHGLLFPAQDAVGLHCHKGALMGRSQLVAHQHPLVHLCKGAFSKITLFLTQLSNLTTGSLLGMNAAPMMPKQGGNSLPKCIYDSFLG